MVIHIANIVTVINSLIKTNGGESRDPARKVELTRAVLKTATTIPYTRRVYSNRTLV